MIKIRTYEAHDAKALWELFYNTVRSVNAKDYTQQQLEAWAPNVFDVQSWGDKMQRLSPFVAEIQGVIVGYADIQKDGFIDHFFCHHEHQGQGVGKALMLHLLHIGKLTGVPRFYASVSITAKPFFERMGFTVLKSQQVEIRGQSLTNFVMEKSSMSIA